MIGYFLAISASALMFSLLNATDAQQAEEVKEVRPMMDITGLYDGCEFTTDWTTNKVENWASFFEGCGAQPTTRVLEVGTFEGRSAIFFAKKLCQKDGSFVVCLDSFSNFNKDECGNVWERFKHNTKALVAKRKVIPMVGDSKKSLGRLILADKLPLNIPVLDRLKGLLEVFDIIYIDGDHSPEGAYTDAVHAWRLLRVGGLMLFDDYVYKKKPIQIGIDEFVSEMGDCAKIEHRAKQLLVRKVK